MKRKKCMQKFENDFWKSFPFNRSTDFGKKCCSPFYAWERRTPPTPPPRFRPRPPGHQASRTIRLRKEKYLNKHFLCVSEKALVNVIYKRLLCFYFVHIYCLWIRFSVMLLQWDNLLFILRNHIPYSTVDTAYRKTLCGIQSAALETRVASTM